ncbi:MAG: DoxX family protein [Devosia sp.]|uniref:DoxX family protein n=1 Tax=Devosia sp. TaxID=1871048 RepID=UPI0024CA460A|nr:DoxX family protein [Devosia sp.]UYN99041.1 MAG: DoxX family protein [Devosia sp.]
MTDQSSSLQASRYFLPGLAGLYARLDGVAWLALRVATGLLLVPHGAQKLFGALGGGGVAGTATFLESVGYSNGTFLAVLIGVVEFFGGLCLAAGIFTRPVALAVLVFMLNAVLFHLKNGFFWTAAGYEYPLFWGVAALFFLVRGGGAYSLDHKLGREF